jgi:hypothetical protein
VALALRAGWERNTVNAGRGTTAAVQAYEDLVVTFRGTTAGVLGEIHLLGRFCPTGWDRLHREARRA